ncbi:tripartite tricarboxylate transporter TctB family protein [Pseudalkalibacillus salsuginis]|uniref:tripartite tricarboxylate transporter TctB family protein n=1 Tax=Pseudalkalibacillus salsuginis TaxID=2910972 RepID=UPI001F409B4B|nr:tripartite tricarboxylate transporter TctB family protein [Pseudalkalibacillus salsuginis]MCF6411369.1 tripartite tricarboxylate transporter TctB family protein [Pseudalkalibacillus salsuginis]
MKAIKLAFPIVLLIISGIFLIASFNVPKANLGNPNGPLYFPIGLSALMLIFCIGYFFQELKNLQKEDDYIRLLIAGRTPKLILVTVLLGIGYAFIFEQTGFLIATILFLGALLFFINGVKKWKANIIVSLCFSFITWYAFSQLLGVSLP